MMNIGKEMEKKLVSVGVDSPGKLMETGLFLQTGIYSKPFDLHYKVFRIFVSSFPVISLVHIIIHCLKFNTRCPLRKSWFPLALILPGN